MREIVYAGAHFRGSDGLPISPIISEVDDRGGYAIDSFLGKITASEACGSPALLGFSYKIGFLLFLHLANKYTLDK